MTDYAPPTDEETEAFYARLDAERKTAEKANPLVNRRQPCLPEALPSVSDALGKAAAWLTEERKRAAGYRHEIEAAERLVASRRELLEQTEKGIAKAEEWIRDLMGVRAEETP